MYLLLELGRVAHVHPWMYCRFVFHCLGMNANMTMSYIFLVGSLQWDSRMYMHLLLYAATAAHTHP